MFRAGQEVRSRASVPVSYLVAVSLLSTVGLVPRLVLTRQEGPPKAADSLFHEQLAETLDRMSKTPGRDAGASGILLAQATEEPGCEPTMEPGCEPTMEPGCEPTMEPGCEPTQEPGCEPTMDPGCEPTMDPANPDCQQPPPTEDPNNPECQEPPPTEDPECVPPTEDPDCPANPVTVVFTHPGEGEVVSGAGIMSMVTITIAEGGPPVTITCIRSYTDGELQYEDENPGIYDPGDHFYMGPSLWAHPLPTPSGHSFSIEVDWERMWMGGGDSGTATDAVNFTVDNTPTISGVTIDPPGEVKGTVMLEAIAAPAGAGQGEMESDYIDKVEFYVGGTKIGEVLGEYAEPVEPDPWPPMGPAYVESYYRIWWNSAEWENCAPKWPDGDYPVKAKAVAGGSWAETTPVTATVHNKGSVSGRVYEVKDGEEVGIEDATVKAIRCGEVKEEATTDAGGNYDMELYPGGYTLEASHFEFVTATQSVSLAPQEQKTDVDFELENRIQSVWADAPEIAADGQMESIVSARVKSQDGGDAEDGTTVYFSTSLGTVDPSSDGTENAVAQTALTSEEPGYAVVTACLVDGGMQQQSLASMQTGGGHGKDSGQVASLRLILTKPDSGRYTGIEEEHPNDFSGLYLNVEITGTPAAEFKPDKVRNVQFLYQREGSTVPHYAPATPKAEPDDHIYTLRWHIHYQSKKYSVTAVCRINNPRAGQDPHMEATPRNEVRIAKRNQLVAVAQDRQGEAWAGDCKDFSAGVWNHCAVPLPTTSVDAQYDACGELNYEGGSLAFFGLYYPDGSKNPGHVGVLVGERTLVQAEPNPDQGGYVISSADFWAPVVARVAWEWRHRKCSGYLEEVDY